MRRGRPQGARKPGGINMKTKVHVLQSALLHLRDAFDECGLDMDKATIIISEPCGKAMELAVLQSDTMIVEPGLDQRPSTKKADGHIREFKVAGVRIQYRPRLLVGRGGKIV